MPIPCRLSLPAEPLKDQDHARKLPPFQLVEVYDSNCGIDKGNKIHHLSLNQDGPQRQVLDWKESPFLPHDAEAPMDSLWTLTLRSEPSKGVKVGPLKAR